MGEDQSASKLAHDRERVGLFKVRFHFVVIHLSMAAMFLQKFQQIHGSFDVPVLDQINRIIVQHIRRLVRIIFHDLIFQNWIVDTAGLHNPFAVVFDLT